MPHPALPSLVLLVRHGATDWSEAGRYTGRSDVPLNARGEEQAATAGRIVERWLAGAEPVVYTSPLERAARTAELALPGRPADVVDALREIDYGVYDGLTTSEILGRDPDWDLFTQGCPGGEGIAQASARCDSFLAKVERTAAGRAVVAFTHGHLGRLLTVRMLGLPPSAAAGLWNDTGSVAALDLHRGRIALVGWNILT